MPEVTIVEREPLMAVGIHSPFIHILSSDCNAPEMVGNLWGRFGEVVEGARHRVGHLAFGIIYGLPESQRSHEHELHYIAGVEVRSLEDQAEALVKREVEGGSYARIVHEGKIERLGETISYLYRDWLPSSGYEHSGVADIELYGEGFDPGSDDSNLEYLISVKRA